MKKLAILGAALALIFTFCFSLTTVRADDSAKELKILSFNIRLSYGEVGKPTEWKNRKGLVADIMRAGDYDFIGIQEAIITQKPDLNQVDYVEGSDLLNEISDMTFLREAKLVRIDYHDHGITISACEEIPEHVDLPCGLGDYLKQEGVFDETICDLLESDMLIHIP